MEVLQSQSHLPLTMVPYRESTVVEMDVDMEMDLGPIENEMSPNVSFTTIPTEIRL